MAITTRHFDIETINQWVDGEASQSNRVSKLLKPRYFACAFVQMSPR